MIHAEAELHEQEDGCRPEGEEAQEEAGPLGPGAEVGYDGHGQGWNGDGQMTRAEPPGIAEVERSVWVHVGIVGWDG